MAGTGINLIGAPVPDKQIMTMRNQRPYVRALTGLVKRDVDCCVLMVVFFLIGQIQAQRPLHYRRVCGTP